jgi:hypothetical protein
VLFFRIAWGVGRHAVLVALTLGNDSGMDAGAKFVRKFVESRVAVNFDGALGGIANDVAVMAPLQVFLKLRLGVRVHGVVEVIGKLF